MDPRRTHAKDKRKLNKVTKILETMTFGFNEPKGSKVTKGTGETWTKFSGKRNPAHKRRLRLELILTTIKHLMAYADILRTAKSNPKRTALTKSDVPKKKIRCRS